MQPVETRAEQETITRSSLWRNLDYMLLWGGQLVSSTGSQVSQLAFPLLILALTHSPVQAGLAGALRALPYLIFSLPAGALIDRWDRKLVMILCDIGRALALGSIPLAVLFGYLTLTQLYLVAVLEGTLFVFFNVAEAACLPRVVTRAQLPTATAQNQASEGITSLVGPALGGTLFALGSLLPFLADALSYTASVISLLFIKKRFQEERVIVARKLHIEIWEGLVWLWRQPLIRFMAVLTGGFNLIFAGYSLIIIVLAQSMHASATVIGIIFAIGGVGAIVGSLCGPYIQRRFSFGQAIIASSWIACIGLALTLVASNAILLGIVTLLTFISGPVYNVVQFSYRSALIPDALQGRVNSVFRLLAFGGQPLGLAVTGWLLQTIHAVDTIVCCAIGMLVLAVLATINTHVRHAQPLSNIS